MSALKFLFILFTFAELNMVAMAYTVLKIGMAYTVSAIAAPTFETRPGIASGIAADIKTSIPMAYTVSAIAAPTFEAPTFDNGLINSLVGTAIPDDTQIANTRQIANTYVAVTTNEEAGLFASLTVMKAPTPDIIGESIQVTSNMKVAKMAMTEGTSFMPDFPASTNLREIHILKPEYSTNKITLNDETMIRDEYSYSYRTLNDTSLNDTLLNDATMTYEHEFETIETIEAEATELNIVVQSFIENRTENFTVTIGSRSTPFFARVIRWTNDNNQKIYLVIYDDGVNEYMYCDSGIPNPTIFVKGKSLTVPIASKDFRFHKDYDGMELFSSCTSDTYTRIQGITYWQNWSSYSDFDGNDIVIQTQESAFTIGSMNGTVSNDFCVGGGCQVSTKLIPAGTNTRRVITGNYDGSPLELFDEYVFNQDVTLSNDLTIVTRADVQTHIGGTLIFNGCSTISPPSHQVKINHLSGSGINLHVGQSCHGTILLQNVNMKDVAIRTVTSGNGPSITCGNVPSITLKDSVVNEHIDYNLLYRSHVKILTFENSQISCAQSCISQSRTQQIKLDNTVFETASETIQGETKSVISQNSQLKIRDSMDINTAVLTEMNSVTIQPHSTSGSTPSLRINSGKIDMRLLNINTEINIELISSDITLEGWAGSNYDLTVETGASLNETGASLKNIKGGQSLTLTGTGTYTLNDVNFNSISFESTVVPNNVKDVVSSSVTFRGCYERLFIQDSTFDEIEASCSSGNSLIFIEELIQTTGLKTIKLENTKFVVTNWNFEELVFNEMDMDKSQVELYAKKQPQLYSKVTTTVGLSWIITGNVVHFVNEEPLNVSKKFDNADYDDKMDLGDTEFRKYIGLPMFIGVNLRPNETFVENIETQARGENIDIYDNLTYTSIDIYDDQTALAINLYDYANTEFEDSRRYCRPGDQMANGTCVACPIGTYSNTYNPRACQPCPRRHFYNDQTGQSECIVCPSGTSTSAATQNQYGQDYIDVVSNVSACQSVATCLPGKHSYGGGCYDFRQCSSLDDVARYVTQESCHCGTDVVPFNEYCRDDIGKTPYPDCVNVNNQKPCWCGEYLAKEGDYCYGNVSSTIRDCVAGTIGVDACMCGTERCNANAQGCNNGICEYPKYSTLRLSNLNGEFIPECQQPIHSANFQKTRPILEQLPYRATMLVLLGRRQISLNNRHMCFCGNSLCFDGWYCQQGKCSAVPKCDTGLSATTCSCGNEMCQPGYFCINGQCVPSCDNSVNQQIYNTNDVSSHFRNVHRTLDILINLTRHRRQYYEDEGYISIWNEKENNVHAELSQYKYQINRHILRYFNRFMRQVIHRAKQTTDAPRHILEGLNVDTFYSEFPDNIPMFRHYNKCCLRGAITAHFNCNDANQSSCTRPYEWIDAYVETQDILSDPLNPDWNQHYAGVPKRNVPTFSDGSKMKKTGYLYSLWFAHINAFGEYFDKALPHVASTTRSCFCHHLETYEMCVEDQYCNRGRCSFTPIETCKNHLGFIRNPKQCICGDTFCDTNQFCVREQHLCTDTSEMEMEVVTVDNVISAQKSIYEL